jgi:hypothetical protein
VVDLAELPPIVTHFFTVPTMHGAACWTGGQTAGAPARSIRGS